MTIINILNMIEKNYKSLNNHLCHIGVTEDAKRLSGKQMQNGNSVNSYLPFIDKNKVQEIYLELS